MFRIAAPAQCCFLLLQALSLDPVQPAPKQYYLQPIQVQFNSCQHLLLLLNFAFHLAPEVLQLLTCMLPANRPAQTLASTFSAHYLRRFNLTSASRLPLYDTSTSQQQWAACYAYLLSLSNLRVKPWTASGLRGRDIVGCAAASASCMLAVGTNRRGLSSGWCADST